MLKSELDAIQKPNLPLTKLYGEDCQQKTFEKVLQRMRENKSKKESATINNKTLPTSGFETPTLNLKAHYRHLQQLSSTKRPI